jgi:hypothetical protein
MFSGIAAPPQQEAIRAAVFAALDAGKLPDYDILPTTKTSSYMR